jgi:hypothetical protein
MIFYHKSGLLNLSDEGWEKSNTNYGGGDRACTYRTPPVLIAMMT